MHEDPDFAQAQVFLDLLTKQTRTLAHELRLARYRDAASGDELAGELRTIQRFIARLQHRFPQDR
ncbi:hypothetical protein [Nocardia brasiliensis]|uniref:hypothetical protein n=1 Tax=Nocardia brasiliensis TaxID=37326 RepID=UPI003D89E3E8